MKKGILLGLISILIISCESEKTSIENFSWMEGTWVREFNGHAQAESWIIQNNQLQGSSFFINNNDTTKMQTLQLELNGSDWTLTQEDVGYDISSTYLLQQINADSMIFSNQMNEWPQIIIYKNSGQNKLDVTISSNKVNDPKRTTFHYIKAIE